ncbi:MAG: biopolymer transporter ExbD [Burkholderiaceae bacterium]
MNFRRQSQHDEPEINFIPLIDLLLVVLIFLMVSTTFSRFTQLKVDLPSASKEQTAETPDEIVVAVTADGQYKLASEKPESLSVTALTSAMRRLAAKRQSPMVVIYADGGASHQSVISVLDAARMAGLEKVTFAAEGGSASK